MKQYKSVLDEVIDSAGETPLSYGITTGEVIDSNDPEQKGRIKIYCPAYGDIRAQADHIPWASYCAPFAGITVDATAGPEEDTTGGVMSYGTWAIPNIGAIALVMLIDGLPNRRVWVGCLPGEYFQHTMPHGRYLSDSKVPLSSTEQPIEPLATNMNEAFSSKIESYEYGTRVIDRQVAAIKPENIGDTVRYSEISDERNFVIERSNGQNTEFNQGYSASGRSSIYSTTTPGLHSWSMDDDPNNCRIRLRTATGHQIIMDDTNERIYVGTAKGNTWIEIDEKGTIDIYSSEDTSIRTDGDLNLSAGKSIRMAAQNGIHMASGSEIRMHSAESMHIRSDGDLKIHSPNTVSEIDGDLAFKVGGKVSLKAKSLAIETSENVNVLATDLIIKTNGYNFDGSGINVLTELGAGTNVIANGLVFASDVLSPTRSLNIHEHFYTAPKIPETPPFTIQPTMPSFPTGGTSSPSITADPTAPADDAADELPAYFNSRTPTHEPFPRSYLDKEMTDKEEAGESTLDLFERVNVDDISSISEYDYDDPNVGKRSDQRSVDFERNEKWRR